MDTRNKDKQPSHRHRMAVCYSKFFLEVATSPHPPALLQMKTEQGCICQIYEPALEPNTALRDNRHTNISIPAQTLACVSRYQAGTRPSLHHTSTARTRPPVLRFLQCPGYIWLTGSAVWVFVCPGPTHLNVFFLCFLPIHLLLYLISIHFFFYIGCPLSIKMSGEGSVRPTMSPRCRSCLLIRSPKLLILLISRSSCSCHVLVVQCRLVV